MPGYARALVIGALPANMRLGYKGLPGAGWPDWAKVCYLATFYFGPFNIFDKIGIFKTWFVSLFNIKNQFEEAIWTFNLSFDISGYSFGNISKNWANFFQSSGHSGHGQTL
jgi:hypothetical protein